MADVKLKSIKFPDLPDRYVIPTDAEDITYNGEPLDEVLESKADNEALENKADNDGYYPNLYAGGVATDAGDTESVPYLFRQSADHSLGYPFDRESDVIVGGTLNWNQLVADSGSGLSVTVQSGHKYYSNIGGTKTIASSDGTAITGLTGGTDNIIDLTALFGSTIADYIYSLEQAEAGAGVAWFKKLFPKDYYAYCEPTLKHVSGLNSHDMTGFNQWDEEWEAGALDTTTGANASGARIRSKNYIPVLQNANYYAKNAGSGDVLVMFYDRDKNVIEGYATGTSQTNNASYVTNYIFTTPPNASYMRFFCSASYGTTYNHDTCINLALDNSRNGEYEPYVKHSYPLDSSLELRGIPKLDSNNKLYYDGDTYEADGTVTRRYGIVDLGTLDWVYDTETLSVPMFKTDPILLSKKAGSANILTPPYITLNTRTGLENVNKAISPFNTTNSKLICIRDDSYSDAVTFKTAMSGVYLVYEFADAYRTTESADPYQTPQWVDDWGAEEYVIDSSVTVPVPVGHETRYQPNLVQKILGLPWDLSMIAPIENGTTASQAYSAGQYFLKDDKFCKALTSIASGATFTLNTNYSVTTVAAELYAAINA